MLVEVPQFVRLPRSPVPEVGGEATVRSAPGLVALLDPSSGAGLGAGYQAPLTIPFGISVTAAFGALGTDDPLQGHWMVRDATIDWQGHARATDTIVCDAQVESVDPRQARVRVQARGSESGDILCASIRILPMHEGRYAALHATLARTEGSAIRHARDDSAIAFSEHTLRTLMQPRGPGEAPLGRRAHPLGNAALGAALSAALAASGERDHDRPSTWRVSSAQATWYLPLAIDSPFRATVVAIDAANNVTTAAAVRSDGRVALRARVRCVRIGAGPR